MAKATIINDFKGLNYQEQREILKKLKTVLSATRPILEHKNLEECPHCGSSKAHKHANYKNGGTRFKCVDCGKTYNELTGTSIHAIKKKDLWDSFIQMMLESKTIRKIALSLNIARQTAFNWRHKVLAALNGLFTKEYKGIVETDDTYFRFNQKGRRRNKIKFEKKLRGISKQKVSVMVTSDRYGVIDFSMVRLGKITKNSLVSVMNIDRFNDGNTVYSDDSRVLKKFFGDLEMNHKTFVAKSKKKGKVHVQNVNNLTARLKNWIKANFNSVSTKYLHNYLNWFSMLDILRGNTKSDDRLWDYMLKSSTAHYDFNVVEKDYQRFLKFSGLKVTI